MKQALAVTPLFDFVPDVDQVDVVETHDGAVEVKWTTRGEPCALIFPTLEEAAQLFVIASVLIEGMKNGNRNGNPP